MNGVSGVSFGDLTGVAGANSITERNKDLQDFTGVAGIQDNPFSGANLGTDSSKKGASIEFMG